MLLAIPINDVNCETSRRVIANLLEMHVNRFLFYEGLNAVCIFDIDGGGEKAETDRVRH